MSFSLAELKRDARRALHDTLAVDATYSDPALAEPVAIKVRYHSKIVRTGDMESGGYAEIIAGIDRLVFDRAALADLGVILVRRGRVIIADYDDATFILADRDPSDGPHTVIWTVTRDREPA